MSAMESFQSQQLFFDDGAFPRGFRRSGTFTIHEAALLEQYGVAMQQLSLGLRTPSTPDEQRFVLICQGHKEASTKLEKVWLKYLKNSRGKRLFSIGSSASLADNAPARSLAILDD
ncbi:DUF413 domain-containing protein [Ferrimonas pelagia]|uniref:Macrodomain Ori protein n=1 Tax=Ferrimonas pelagia TaxID=1177826 RepID=A0ABP9F865_9GAMM